MAIDKSKNTRIVITIDKDTKNRLQELAESDNRTMTNYIVNLIKKDINEKNNRWEALRSLFLLYIVFVILVIVIIVFVVLHFYPSPTIVTLPIPLYCYITYGVYVYITYRLLQ